MRSIVRPMLALATLLVASGCTFNPRSPAGAKVLCRSAADCRPGEMCVPDGGSGRSVCCAGAACGVPVAADRPDAGADDGPLVTPDQPDGAYRDYGLNDADEGPDISPDIADSTAPADTIDSAEVRPSDASTPDLKRQGERCNGNDRECATGKCAQGYCCNVECGSGCGSCAMPGSEGTCTLSEPLGSRCRMCGYCAVVAKEIRCIENTPCPVDARTD
jgi:hypothetical protein